MADILSDTENKPTKRRSDNTAVLSEPSALPTSPPITDASASALNDTSPLFPDTAQVSLPTTEMPALLTGKHRMRAIAIYPFGWTRRDLRRGMCLALVGWAALWFFLQIQSLLPPFLISLFLAALLEPTLQDAERHGRKRFHAILSIYLLVLLTMSLLALLVVPKAKGQLEDISKNFTGYYTSIEKNIDVFLHKNAHTLKQLGVKEESVSELVSQRSGLIKNSISNVLGGVGDVVQTLASKFIWIIIIPIASFFLMLDYPLLRARCLSLFPENAQGNADEVSSQIVDVFSSYLKGLAKVCTLFGVCVCVILYIYGMEYALILGMLAGMFYAVPYVGQIGTAIVVGSVAYSMDTHNAVFFLKIPGNSILYALVVVGSVVLLNNIFDQIVMPKVVGEKVGLHPVVSLFAVTTGATLFGVPGMLLAMPVAGSIRVILRVIFPRMATPPDVHLYEKTPVS